MADSTVHALADGVSVADTDEFYATRSPYGVGNDVKLTGLEIAAKAPVQSVAGRTGAITIAAGDIASGLIALARGGLNADISATGGASFVLRQDSSGAAVTVSQLAVTNITGAAPLASPTFSGTVTGPDGGTWTSTALAAGSATTWQAPLGSVLAAGGPGLAFLGITNSGFAAATGNVAFWQGGNIELNLSANSFRIRRDATYGWASQTNNNAPADTGMSRTGAAAIAVGNGTQGDTTGTVACATLSGNSGSVSVPLGTVTAGGGPGLNFIGINSTGIAANSAGGGNLAIWQGGNIELNLSANSFRIRRDATYGWASATNNNAPSDLLLSRQAAATLHLGAADAASPIAQTFGVQSVVAGNGNTAGATWTIQGSLSNGSGGGDVLLQTTLSSAASGSQNTAATALTLKGGSQAVITSAAVGDTGYGYATPAAGGTVTLGAGVYHQIIDPAGTLATLTINMTASPFDGQCVDIKISQIVTALTVSGNGNSVSGNPTSAAVGSSFTGIYRAANTTWYF